MFSSSSGVRARVGFHHLGLVVDELVNDMCCVLLFGLKLNRDWCSAIDSRCSLKQRAGSRRDDDRGCLLGQNCWRSTTRLGGPLGKQSCRAAVSLVDGGVHGQMFNAPVPGSNRNCRESMSTSKSFLPETKNRLAPV